MSSGNDNTIPTQFFVENKTIFFPDYTKNEQYDIETPFDMNISSQSSGLSGKENEIINFKNNVDSPIFIPSTLDPNPLPTLDEIIQINSKDSDNKKISFFSSEKSNLFSYTEKNFDLVIDEENILKRKRYNYQRPRRDNQDNIRKKIKRGFFNNALVKNLNDKLRSIGNNKYFNKFPQHFVSDVNRIRNKEIFSMTLAEIFEKKELYLHEGKTGNALNYYFQNLKVFENEDIKENKELKKIFNKTICELYEEYINSDEFKIIEINRLKQKNMQDEYISRYICLAKTLILYFTQ
jgi:hypothetical protein